MNPDYNINYCNENPLNFMLPEDDWHYDVVDRIRNDSETGNFLEINNEGIYSTLHQ